MNWKDTQKQYGIVTKFFHWAVVILIVAQFGLGFTMASLPREGYETVGGLSRGEWYMWHQSVGVVMLIIVIARIIWRRLVTLPDWAETLSEGERKYAHWVERILYWLMVLVPLSGLLSFMFEADYLSFFGLINIPTLVPHNEAVALQFGLGHAITRVLIVIVAVLHVGLILKHQFVNKDRLLNRMLP